VLDRQVGLAAPKLILRIVAGSDRHETQTYLVEARRLPTKQSLAKRER